MSHAISEYFPPSQFTCKFRGWCATALNGRVLASRKHQNARDPPTPTAPHGGDLSNSLRGGSGLTVAPSLRPEGEATMVTFWVLLG